MRLFTASIRVSLTAEEASLLQHHLQKKSPGLEIGHLLEAEVQEFVDDLIAEIGKE